MTTPSLITHSAASLRRSFGRLLVLGGVLALAAERAGAQAVPDSALGRETQALAKIVVTATRAAVPAVTSATTVISGAELRNRGTTHIADALRDVPGFAVVQTGSFGGNTAVYLRGGESGYTRVLVDGVPVNEPGGAFDFSQLTTEGVDRIEIVRGPTSVLYGSDAVAGVVQIFTQDGRGPSSIRLNARAGSYGTVAADVTLQGGDDSRAYTLTIGQFESDGIYAFNNRYRHRAITASARVAAAFDVTARLLFRYADDDTHVPTDGSGVPVDSNAHQPADRRTFSVELARELGSKADASLSLASHATSGGFDDRSDSPGDTLGFYAFRSLDVVSRRRLEGVVNVRPASGYVVSVGGVVEDQTQHSLSQYRSEFGNGTDALDASRTTNAAFLQAIGARRRMAWSLGGRVDHNGAFGTFVTHRLGVALTPRTTTRLRAAAGSAFREPTFFQNFATGIALGNPNLRPERSGSWEVGLDQQLWGDRLVLATTYFQQRFRDVIEYTFAPPSASDPNFFNIAAAGASGAEVELRVSTDLGLSAAASHTALRTRVDQPGFDVGATGYFRPGQPLLRRPARSTSASASYRFRRRADATVRWHAVGIRQDIDYDRFERVDLPRYSLVDFSGRVAIGGSGERTNYLTLRMANALDEQYEAVSGFRAPGRTLLVGVQLQR